MNTSFNPRKFFSSLSFYNFFFNRSNLSYARLLENSVLSSLVFSGNAIDIGGGSLSSYSQRLIGLSSYESINIDSSLQPTYIIDPSAQLYPVSSSCYQHCLLFNVLEHIYDWSTILSESSRLLVDGGSLHILVPFLYPVHPCPDDFLRPCSSFLYRNLSSFGFTNIKIFPLSLGPFTSSYSLFPNLPILHFFLSRLFVFLDFTYLHFFPSKHQRYCNSHPLIFYCTATK